MSSRDGLRNIPGGRGVSDDRSSRRSSGRVSIAELRAQLEQQDVQTLELTDLVGSLRRPRGRPEGKLQDSVIELARLYGWAWYHVNDSRRDVAGFLDLELARYHPFPRIIKAELKDRGRQPTDEQVEWLNLYAHIGAPVEAYLWYPRHLEAIAEVLKPEWRRGHADARMFGLWTLDPQPVALRRVPAQAQRRGR